MKKLGRISWMLLAMAIIGWASYETFGSQFTLPLMVDFGVDETTVNMLMSMAPMYALTIAQFMAWAISNYGHVSNFAMLGTALMMSLRISTLVPGAPTLSMNFPFPTPKAPLSSCCP